MGVPYTLAMDSLAGVRIVFFDAGGTLVAPREDVGEVYARAARRQGLDVEPADVLAAFHAAFRSQRLAGRTQDRAWWRAVVDATFGPFGRVADPAGLFEELYEHFSSPERWALLPGAVETVTEIRARGYRTGMISNWDDRLPVLLRSFGLEDLLDPVVVSCRVGVEKPDRRIFEAALSSAATEPREALMVGDDLEADVAGATALGMRAVWIPRPGAERDGVPALGRLSDLLEILPGGVG